MATNIDRLKNAIKTAMKAEQAEKEDADASLDRITQAIAEAVIYEITHADIKYNAGLTAGNVAVTGLFNNTIS